MTWTDAHTLALRQSLFVIGALSAAAGVFVRDKHRGDLNGLGVALIVVGAIMVLADPVGRLAGFW